MIFRISQCVLLASIGQGPSPEQLNLFLLSIAFIDVELVCENKSVLYQITLGVGQNYA